MNRTHTAVIACLALALGGVFSTAACTVDATDRGPDAATPSADSGSAFVTCSAPGAGTGTIAVVVAGLPDGIPARVLVAPAVGAADSVTGSTISDHPAGAYRVSADRVVKPDPIVRTIYQPTVSDGSVCLAGTQTVTVTVTYAPIAPSGKLWATSANSTADQLVAFGSADLAASGKRNATVAMKGSVGAGAGKAVAFDAEGNLWSLGGTTVDAPLVRFPAASLAISGEKAADRKITPKLSDCAPALNAIALDRSGALFATVLCSNQILRIDPTVLGASAEYTPSADDFMTGTSAPRQLAFDKDGNLWVSGDDGVHRYPSASLARGASHAPDLAVVTKTESSGNLPADALAFDKDGNLWATSFGGNVVFKLTPADLTPTAATKDVVPSVQIKIQVTALLESLAFDESDGVWLTYAQGEVARLAPAQLATSSSPGTPTVPQTIVTSAEIGSAGGQAFFPAPAALPLVSRFE
jgi:sugar lactone lactonase YvrE